MIFFLVSFLSLLLFLIKPLPLLPSWANELRLLFVLLSQEFLYHSIQWFKNYRLVSAKILKIPFTMSTNKKKDLRVYNAKEEEVKETKEAEISPVLMDLPELALELILEKLSPDGLLNMAGVCSSLRDRCRSNYLWERHFREKWEGIIGQLARREWESYCSSSSSLNKSHNGFVTSRSFNWLVEYYLSSVWPFQSKQESGSVEGERHLDVDSVMVWYLSLESGRFRFPAQVYNREQKGHVGFMMSCYDAELSYDSRTDTFHARYAPHGHRVISLEDGVEWDRLRPPPVDTPAHNLHISDCLNDLHPGDHIEIQWRRNKDFPYGWWYGVVGHSESCDGDERHCHCYNSDTIIVEFNQYSPGSRWRRTLVNRKDHREEGNESEGFYGGIRKLYDKHEISMWNQLWPTEILE